MATIVTVHGTFAHSTSGATDDGAVPDLQWWQSGSTFEHDMREMIDAAPGMGTGKLEVTRFEWSGDNSENSRRDAGRRLFGYLKTLEAKAEPYCVVGHSHGGSVLGWALLESAARRERLQSLKRWITVGTPFVSLQKERMLFQRLDLLRKVIFVASLMLFLMWLVYILAELFASPDHRMLFGSVFPGVLVVTATMMSLPIVVLYFVLRYWNSRTLLHYRRSVRNRAADSFAQRWLSFTHTDDEAVQGLAFLPGAKLFFFDKMFAVPALTMLSVFALPLIYLLVLTSPTIMIGVADWLKTNVYESNVNPETEQALRASRERLRSFQQQSRANEGERQAIWREFRNTRRQLEARYPDLHVAERALRFKQRFFERDGKPCEGGQLCGGGRDILVNSGLLLHIVTDELSSAIGGEGIDDRGNWWLRLLLPAVVVPVAFGLLSLLLMLVINSLARLISTGASNVLNRITNAEVKRAAFGNDTEGEIALGAVDRPTWIERSPPRLPAAIADLVTAYSNGVANQSIAKFRRAIGQLASAEPKHTADSAITTYFTWKELVHASYFDVAEFRKLMAQGISRHEGFSPSRQFQADPDFARTAQWLAEIEGAPGTTEKPASGPPTIQDTGAVATVVASTVKREP
jgi:hypothetical protein